jgi:uncharacterized protein (DUF2267 family)
VNDERFLSIVQREAAIEPAAVERAVRATLEVLAERVLPGEAKHAAELLPEQIGRWLVPKRPREIFDADDFVRRVANRLELYPPAGAEPQIAAVFLALSRALTGREFTNLAAELPKEYTPLLGRAVRSQDATMSLVDFVDAVADRAGTDFDAARLAAEADLETLAERIAGGQVEDIRKELPAELHDPLRRGVAHTGGNARRMSLQEFLSLAADREGVPTEAARDHARAVFATLREALTEKAFHDVESELPREYAVLTSA